MKIYLAARYGRRLELCGYREQLRKLGHVVQARWLDGSHQISVDGNPLQEDGETLAEDSSPEGADLRAKFAADDIEDVLGSDMVISFTEQPRSASGIGRGGRHVEFGIAWATDGVRLLVVGHRENIFHWLPGVEFFGTWEEALETLKAEKLKR